MSNARKNREMSVRDDIENHAKPEDKECLLWLLEKWHMSSEWFSGIIVGFKIERHGVESYKTKRIYFATKAGICLYNHREELNEQ